MNLLKGKLSYGLSGLAVAGAIAGYFLGIVDERSAVATVWAGLALFGIRRAI